QAVCSRLTWSRYFGEGKHILGDDGPAADIRMCADADELVHAAQRSHHGPVFHDYVARQSRPVDQHGMIADHRVMTHMRIGHDQGMAAHTGHSAAFGGSTIEGHGSADHVVVADLQPRLFATETHVLWFGADGAKGKETVVRADSRGSLDAHVRD